MRVRYCCVWLFLIALASLGFAEPTPLKADREIQFEADQMDYDKSAELVRLVGKVKFSSSGAILTAPVATYRIDKKVAEFLGGVKFVGEQSTLTGKEMKVWYAETRSILKGDVRIISQYRNSKMGGHEEPTILTCETLEYDWGARQGVAKGGVKMRQGGRRAFADRAELDEGRHQVLLIGSVRVEQEGGDWLTASRAIYNTLDQTVRAEGRVVAKTRLESASESQKGEAIPEKSLPKPSLIAPAFELLPMHSIPAVPLPLLDRPSLKPIDL